MCFAFCLFFFACSPVKMSTTQYASGEISTEIEFDVSTLSGTGINSQKQKAYELVSAYHNQIVSAYKTKLVDLFDNIYKDNASWQTMGQDSKFAFIISAYPRFYACDKDTNKLVGGAVTPNATQSVAEATTIKVEIAFKSIYAYLAFYCPSAYKYDAETKNIVIDKDFYSTLIDTPIMVLDDTTEATFFATKIVETCSPFFYNKEEPKLLSQYKTYSAGTSVVDVAKTELGLSDEVAKYVFSFTTPYSRLHSDGEITRTQDGYTHTWAWENDIDGQIKVFRNYANQVVYYGIALIVGGILMAVAIVLSIVKNRKSKKPIEEKAENVKAENVVIEISSAKEDSLQEKPKKKRIRKLKKDDEKENSESKKTIKKSAKKEKSKGKTSRKPQKQENLTGIELLQAIDDLMNGKENDDEER